MKNRYRFVTTRRSDTAGQSRRSRGLPGLLVFAIFAALLLTGLFTPGSGTLSAVSPLWAADDWKDEFEDICHKTDESMKLTIEELKTLVARCDKLKPRIEALDSSTRKVYLKRLQMCRDLYAYVLQVKLQEQEQGPRPSQETGTR